MSQSEFKRRLKVLMNKPENQVCSDCPERQPRWASLIVPPPGSPPGSLPIGAFCCLECSGSHRRLGVHISFVRSITLDSWKEKEVLAMENGGNHKVNVIFEKNLNVSKPTASASGPVRERFIRDKYERRKYYDPSKLQQFQDSDDSSSSDDSEDEQPKRNTVRAPSEAARMRAQARKQRMGAVAAPQKAKSSPSPSKQSRAVQKRLAPKRESAPAPQIDLLDFGLPPVAGDPGPPPNPPSASPSPTLDMFKDMTVTNGIAAPSETQDTNNASSNNTQTKKMTSDDILGLFNAPTNNNMGYNNPSMMSNNMNNNMNNGMMMNNNQMGAMNMNPMIYNQQMQNNNTNLFMNGSTNGTAMTNNSNSMPAQQMPQNNLNFFNGMQNMNGNMSGGQTQMQMSNNIGMPMQQTQQQDFGIAPMGGTPSNLTVMGGEGMNQQSTYGRKDEQETKNGFEFMGESTASVSSSGNPQMNQFASFGSFR